jgi:hypothetical protein
MKVEESAYVWLMRIHPVGEKCGFSGQIFGEDFDEMSVCLFVGGAVDKDMWFFF